MLEHLRTIVGRRRDAETGVSALEYGLLFALIVAVIVLGVMALGGLVRSTFSDSCSDGSGRSNSTTGEAADCTSDR